MLVVKEVFLPWYTSATHTRRPTPPPTHTRTPPRFLVQNVLRSEQEGGARFDPLALDLDKADNVLDRCVCVCVCVCACVCVCVCLCLWVCAIMAGLVLHP